MKVHSHRRAMLGGLLALLTGCIDFELEKDSFCQREPSRCQSQAAQDGGSPDAGSLRSPPTLVKSSQSSATANPGQQITFSVVASAPAGSVLGFSWSTTDGTLGTPSSTELNSQVTWTAPSCVKGGPYPSITVTLKNTFELETTKTFTVTGLAACVPGWTSANPMGSGRSNHVAIVLLNGKVLAVSDGTSELYDPSTGQWTQSGRTASPRRFGVAALLPGGKVLLTGGVDANASRQLATSEIYDPALGTWSDAANLPTARVNHTLTLLLNGNVLMVGGYDGMTLPTRADVYNPETNIWSQAGIIALRREGHTATLLFDGKVLIAGGFDFTRAAVATTSTTEMYDPASNTWSSSASMTSPRSGHTATLLSDGKILVAGGSVFSDGDPPENNPLATAELYDPRLGSWSRTGAMASPRSRHQATLLPDGRVLVSGGRVGNVNSGNVSLATAEVYDPRTGAWSRTAAMAASRFNHAATLLLDGRALISGGRATSIEADPSLATVELYTP